MYDGLDQQTITLIGAIIQQAALDALNMGGYTQTEVDQRSARLFLAEVGISDKQIEEIAKRAQAKEVKHNLSQRKPQRKVA